MVLKEATNLDIVFFSNYKNPEFNSLKEYHSDIKNIKKLKRYIKNFFIKKDKISFHKLLNMFIFISNVFDENSYNEVLTYIAYKYFNEDMFDLYVNSIFYFFEIVIDQNYIKNDYIVMLSEFEN